MKSVQLLLLDNVDNLGIIGDVVKVKAGYARNFLLPFGLATKPTEGAIKALASRRAEVEAELAKLREQQKELIAKLEGHEITLERSANDSGILYGGITQHDIAEALREEGYPIEDRYIRIGDQIKRLDSYDIPLVIDKELKTEIKVWIVSDQPITADDEDADAEEAADDGEAEIIAEVDESEAETANA